MTMSPAVGLGGKAPSLDFRNALLEKFAICQKANQRMLGNMPGAAWHTAPPSGKGRTIADVAAHIQQVRLMWLSAADKSAKPLAKLQPEKAARAEVQAALRESAAAVESVLQKALHDPAGKVPSCKPNVITFIGFLIAHDSHHRGQIAMLARQVGHPVDRKTFYGRWEWGSLWRDCGFGSTTGGPGSK
jgi:uncharacterized damage-inducible protein DinB